MHRVKCMMQPSVDVAGDVRFCFATLGRGLAAVVFSMVLLSGALPPLQQTVIGLVVYFLVDALLVVYAAKRARVSRGAPGLLAAVSGIDVVAAIASAVVPTAAALRVVAGLRAIVGGVCDAIWSRHHGTSDMLTLNGVAAVALGAVLLLAWPGSGELALPWLVGLQLMVSGALLTGGALSELRRVVSVAPQPA